MKNILLSESLRGSKLFLLHLPILVLAPYGWKKWRAWWPISLSSWVTWRQTPVSFWNILLELRINSKKLVVSNLEVWHLNILKSYWYSSWWFQPIWKILVKIRSFPKVGLKITNIWNHPQEVILVLCWGCNRFPKLHSSTLYFSLSTWNPKSDRFTHLSISNAAGNGPRNTDFSPERKGLTWKMM